MTKGFFATICWWVVYWSNHPLREWVQRLRLNRYKPRPSGEPVQLHHNAGKRQFTNNNWTKYGYLDAQRFGGFQFRAGKLTRCSTDGCSSPGGGSPPARGPRGDCGARSLIDPRPLWVVVRDWLGIPTSRIQKLQYILIRINPVY